MKLGLRRKENIEKQHLEKDINEYKKKNTNIYDNKKIEK